MKVSITRSLTNHFAAIAIGIALSTSAMAALFATGGGAGPGAGLSGLWIVDPLNGKARLAWNLQNVHIYAGGLAYDVSTDTLYATGVENASTGTSRLFTIDRNTGVLTAFAGMSANISVNSGGLAISPVTGVMYATGTYSEAAPHQSTALFTIDKITGAATLLGFAGGNCCTGGDYGITLSGLGFSSDGTLFANGSGGGPSFPNSSTSHLFTVNLGSGAATNIGPSGVTLGRSLKYSGLAFRDDGTLLSLGSLDAASGALYSVSTATGTATSLSGTGLPYGTGPIHFGVDGGLAFAPAPDTDSDSVPDVIDNCKLVANVNQLDANADGYGNICDADLNNSGTVTTADFGLLRSVLGQSASASATAAAADMNGSGTVTTADFGLLRARIGTAPGPSGLACAGSVPCL